jgi:DNA-binding GntR family transcriptional regulator
LDTSGDVVRRLGVQALATKERYLETFQEHENIIRALKTNDLSRARQAMIYHVLRTKETIYKYWKKPIKR